MASLDQVLSQMKDAGLPLLPANHPVLDGKVHRFGPKKKAWYLLREVQTRSGASVIGGAFGVWQGASNNAVPVTIDWKGISPEERAAAEQRQREYEAREQEKRERLAAGAANRASLQWDAALKADPAGQNESPYLRRKQVTIENARVTGEGVLLVPMKKYSKAGTRLVGLQKIAADGSKLFNKGMDKSGAACLLGLLHDDAPVIGLAEGYATGRSIRGAADIPLLVAFDAGNLLPVAQGLRRDFPAAHLIFFADDDWQLEQRFVERLAEDFKISCPVALDGLEQNLAADDGARVLVTAGWRTDAHGVPYIEADVRSGRQVRSLKFENAGIAKAKAAASAVGNASVVWPRFAARGDNKWTDFNDLQVAESADAVREQVRHAINQAATVVSPAPFQRDVPDRAEDVSEVVRPALIEPEQCPAPSPAPLPENAPVSTGLISLDWALAHCALVQGSTDVWDSLNKLRMKRPAFIAMVGKEAARQWEAHELRRSISPRNLPKLQRGVAVDEGGGGDGMREMLERYTLLYPTKALWDAEKKVIASYDAVALARGADLTARWLEHPLHMEKDLDKLVFDPTQRVDLNTHINMFEGFPLKPKQDDPKAELVLDLLYSLCSSESNATEVFEWVLRWLAYPLQHPGAKMQTALLFFGEKQGTGKSLFFEGIVMPIYGVHGATGGQHQLESTYTMWRSQKLFVLFEEILSRQDKYSYFGLIKHMITGRTTPISQKFKDDRVEANHMNCVMLSNEFQAIPLEPEDRRFLVCDVRTPLDPALLHKIKAGLEGGGLIEAFYHFLLKYPLDGFDPHTKPVMTDAKRRVIRFGLPAWDSFYQAWAGEELEVPFCSCLSEDLYRVYDRWCNRNGERSISLTKFAELIATRVPKSRQHVAIGTSAKRLLTVFQVPSKDDESLSKQCQRFRDLADIKERA